MLDPNVLAEMRGLGFDVKPAFDAYNQTVARVTDGNEIKLEGPF